MMTMAKIAQNYGRRISFGIAILCSFASTVLVFTRFPFEIFGEWSTVVLASAVGASLAVAVSAGAGVLVLALVLWKATALRGVLNPDYSRRIRDYSGSNDQ